LRLEPLEKPYKRFWTRCACNFVQMDVGIAGEVTVYPKNMDCGHPYDEGEALSEGRAIDFIAQQDIEHA